MQQIKAHEGASGLIVSLYGDRWSEDFGEEQRSGDSMTNAYRGIILYKFAINRKEIDLLLKTSLMKSVMLMHCIESWHVRHSSIKLRTNDENSSKKCF